MNIGGLHLGGATSRVHWCCTTQTTIRDTPLQTDALSHMHDKMKNGYAN